MKIHHLKIKNFKRFKAFELDLSPQFTVLVGDNGVGKTSVLDALAIAVSIWITEVPDSVIKSGNTRNIQPNEIRLNMHQKGDRIQFTECKPVVIEVAGEIDGEKITWQRLIPEEGVRTSNREAKPALKKIAELFERDQECKSPLYPIIAYYGVGDGWRPSNTRKQNLSDDATPARRWAAFDGCLYEQRSFTNLRGLRDWFKREALQVAWQGQWRPGYQIVKSAVLACFPEADDLWFDADRVDIVLLVNDAPCPFANLSAGQKMMTALVADIAIKAVTQNAALLPEPGQADNNGILSTFLAQASGLVLIDELDAHLHPRWQRRVVKDLEATFPALQFVATTHSPQIIGEVATEKVRLMDFDQETTFQPHLAYGTDSNSILDYVMSAAQSRNQEIQELFNSVEDLMADDEFDAAEAKLQEIRTKMGGEEDGGVVFLRSKLSTLRLLAADEEDEAE